MMKKAIYFIMVVIACLCIAIGFSYYDKNEYVSIAEVQQEAAEIWNLKIAETANSAPIQIKFDDEVVSEGENGVYMNDSLGIMLPKDIISEIFDCRVRSFGDNLLVIEKEETSIKLTLDSNVISVGDTIINLESSFIIKEGIFYVPLEALTVGLGYDYLWESVTNTAVITSRVEQEINLPSYFSRVDLGYLPEVKDQGRLGTCWAFASLTSIETSLLPEEPLLFSEDHMSLNRIFGLSQENGGEYSMAIAYLASWKGPVAASEDPYGDGVTVDGLEPLKHVQEVQVIKSKDIETIKKMVYEYGAVQSSLYLSTTTRYAGETNYYNSLTHSYCYTGDEKPNHDVVVVGWDDNYSKENFNVPVGGDGAFICRNSWGSDFGDQGNFYISYYDTVMGTSNVVYTKIEDTDNYDNIYQSDLVGWVGQIGYSMDTAYFANVYTAKNDEKLKAVSFYATDKNTEYSIYVCEDFNDTSDLDVTEDPVITGKFSNAGYYTVDLEKAYNIDEGDKYAIIVKIKTPGSKRPVAIEYISNEKTANVKINDGESYLSLRGLDWESLEEEHECNACLKAFTDDR